jgi:hypothetical protein
VVVGIIIGGSGEIVNLPLPAVLILECGEAMG